MTDQSPATGFKSRALAVQRELRRLLLTT